MEILEEFQVQDMVELTVMMMTDYTIQADQNFVVHMKLMVFTLPIVTFDIYDQSRKAASIRFDLDHRVHSS